jgi:hypothetical protein
MRLLIRRANNQHQQSETIIAIQERKTYATKSGQSERLGGRG